MPSRDWLLRAKSLAALVMTGGILWKATVVAAVALAVALMLHRREPPAKQLAALHHATSRVAEAKKARRAAGLEVESAKGSVRAAEGAANAVLSRANMARTRARVMSADDVMVSATLGGPAVSVRLPTPVVERMQLDSTAVATLGTLVRWKDTVIVAQDRRITADSMQLVATANAFDALQRVRAPRCARKCGIALGIAGMVAAAVAVEQLRRAFR